MPLQETPVGDSAELMVLAELGSHAGLAIGDVGTGL